MHNMRRHTRIEDSAYCLFGIFGLHMPLLYGEGLEAFARLQHAILNKTGDESVLALHGDDYIISLFPRMPKSYQQAGSIKRTGVYGDTAITVSDRWAEVGLSKGRSNVFYNRDDRKDHVVRLNCARFDGSPSPSHCILFLWLGGCGHFQSMLPEQFSSYLSNENQKYPYCERDLANLKQWLPMRAGKANVIHHTTMDAITCYRDLWLRTSGADVPFLLKDNT